MVRALVALLAVLGLPLTGYCDPLPGPIDAEVIKVVDGDTIKVRANIWVDQTVIVSVRLRGVDAPELYRPKCKTEKILARSAKASVNASTPVGSTVRLTQITRDKYGGRVVAYVQTNDGENLGARLIAQGQAIAMGGEKPWCRG